MARTGFHVVDISPWPFCCSVAVLGVASSAISFLHLGSSLKTSSLLLLSASVLVVTMLRWWGDIILESTFLGRHTSLVVRNLRLGMILFIVSEIFFFVSFFWAFFNSMLGEISMKDVGHWPPLGVNAIQPWKVPALNTAVLVSSGITVTAAHKALSVHNKCPVPGAAKVGEQGGSDSAFFKNFLLLLSVLPFVSKSASGAYEAHLLKDARKASGAENFTPDLEEAGQLVLNAHLLRAKETMGLKARRSVLNYLGATILLGLYFTWLQYNEYYVASFTIADGIYGSTFYLMTGFHGVHVLVGTIFLIVCWFRAYHFHFSFQRHYFGFDAAVWYWHFVDGVWVLLFFTVYVWGYQ